MTSFLICFHEDHDDIYRDGLPIGVVRDGKFTIHSNTMPDGSKVQIQEKPVTEILRRAAATILSIELP